MVWGSEETQLQRHHPGCQTWACLVVDLGWAGRKMLDTAHTKRHALTIPLTLLPPLTTQHLLPI